MDQENPLLVQRVFLWLRNPSIWPPGQGQNDVVIALEGITLFPLN
jgi:hypothetical protein